jgi:uncharacterized membrane protein
MSARTAAALAEAAAQRHARTWPAVTMAAIAIAGVVISAYLTVVKLSGGQPYCGPIVGCETVNTSPYSSIFGIPVALIGMAASGAILAGVLSWYQNGSRNGLLLAYGLGLASLPILAYLTYLELFVIHAVCVWCVGYAVTVIVGWLVATREVLRLRQS